MPQNAGSRRLARPGSPVIAGRNDEGVPPD